MSETVRVPVTEEQFIVACIIELGTAYAQVDEVRKIASDLRSERSIDRAQVLEYLSRFEVAVRSVEPVLVPHLEHLLTTIAAAREAAGINRAQAQS